MCGEVVCGLGLCVQVCVYGTCLVCVRDASRVSPGVSMKGMRVASRRALTSVTVCVYLYGTCLVRVCRACDA